MAVLTQPRSRRLASPRGLARRRALGAPLHLAVDHRVPRLHAVPMVATLGFTFMNIKLEQDEPLQFVGLRNYEKLLDDPTAIHSLARHVQVRAPWLPIASSAVRGRAAAQQRHLRGTGAFRVLFFMPYVVPFVAGVLIWQGMLGSEGTAGSTSSCSSSAIEHPPDWLESTTWIYPGLVIMGVWGIGAGVIINLAGLRASRPSSTTRPRSTAPGRGRAPPRDDPDDVAGHLLLADPRSGRGAAVLPRAARAQERHRASRAARRSSTTSTSTRTSSRSRTCPTARRSPGCCSRSPCCSRSSCSGSLGAGSTTRASAEWPIGVGLQDTGGRSDRHVQAARRRRSPPAT